MSKSPKDSNPDERCLRCGMTLNYYCMNCQTQGIPLEDFMKYMDERLNRILKKLETLMDDLPRKSRR